MQRQHNKLVRDRIPEIIQAAGGQCEVRAISEEEYLQALRCKLIEEAQEVVTASSSDLVLELADLFEVIDVLLEAHNIQRSAVIEMQEARRLERGGFQERVFLLWSERA
ncbi:MAG: nucleoside triphosphate pyrophosphohydrolase [Elainellaceae cyanobacterium]